MIKTITIGIASMLIAAAACAQQSTTNTDCNVNGQQVDCTSTTTTPPPPSGGALEGINKAMAANRDGLKLTLQCVLSRLNRLRPRPRQSKRRKTMPWSILSTVDKTATGSVTTGDGQVKTCTDELAYSKAECTVNPTMDLCKLFMSHAEMEKSFGEPSPKTLETTLEPRNTTSRCISIRCFKPRRSGPV